MCIRDRDTSVIFRCLPSSLLGFVYTQCPSFCWLKWPLNNLFEDSTSSYAMGKASQGRSLRPFAKLRCFKEIIFSIYNSLQTQYYWNKRRQTNKSVTAKLEAGLQVEQAEPSILSHKMRNMFGIESCWRSFHPGRQWGEEIRMWVCTEPEQPQPDSGHLSRLGIHLECHPLSLTVPSPKHRIFCSFDWMIGIGKRT